MRAFLRVAGVVLVFLGCREAAWAQILYATDFSDSTGWDLGSSGGCNDVRWDVDALPANPGYLSPPYSLNVNNDVDFGCGCDIVPVQASSPPIDLGSTLLPVLQFWYWSDVEPYPHDLPELRVVRAGTATVLHSEYLETWYQWRSHRVPLIPSWGEVQILFRFDTADFLLNCGKGWFVDDLIVAELFVAEGCPAPSVYCLAAPNSVASEGARIHHQGSTSIADDDLRVVATSCPPVQPALFYFGSDAVQLPFGDGWRCVAGTTFRLPVTITSTTGEASHDLAFGTWPASRIQPGSLWNFQCLYRDPDAGGADFNLTDALVVKFCP